MADEKTVLSTKEKIFINAVFLFSENGYHGVSIRNIVKEVGIKESSLYNHYSSKQELLQAIFDRMEAELSQRFLEQGALDQLIEQHSVEELLFILLENFIRYWDDPLREQMWFIVSMEQYRNKAAAEIILNETERNIAGLTKIFSRLIEKHKIPDQDPEMLAIDYGYGVRALHLEYALRNLHGLEPEQFYEKIKDRISFFCEKLRN